MRQYCRPLSGLLLSTYLAVLPARADAAASSLVPNGNFQGGSDKAGWPTMWPTTDGATCPRDPDGNRYLRLQAKDAGSMVSLFLKIPIDASYKALQLTFRYRLKDVASGAENWNDARIIMHCVDKDEKELNPNPDPPHFAGTTDGWQKAEYRFKVPEGTKTLQFMPAMFKAKSGTFDLDDIVLAKLNPKVIDEANPDTMSPKSEPVPQSTNMTAGPLPPALHVKGTGLETAKGERVTLQGVEINSLDFNWHGDGVLQSVRVMTGEWKANVIRLPVSDRFWFGLDATQSDGGALYRRLVDAAVHLAANNGAYTVLSLHDAGVPTDRTVAFWADVAKRYKNNSALLYAVFDNTGPLTWDVWRDGGVAVATDPKTKKASSVKAMGMRALVAAVRKAGVENVLVLGLPAGGSDCAGLNDARAVKDAGPGGGLLYDAHVFATPDGLSAAAKKYPILVGQCGIDPRAAPADASAAATATPDPYLWAPNLLGTFRRDGLSWIASAVHRDVGTRLIRNWTYEPSPFWGTFVRSVTAGHARYDVADAPASGTALGALP